MSFGDAFLMSFLGFLGLLCLGLVAMVVSAVFDSFRNVWAGTATDDDQAAVFIGLTAIGMVLIATIIWVVSNGFIWAF